MIRLGIIFIFLLAFISGNLTSELKAIELLGHVAKSHHDDEHHHHGEKEEKKKEKGARHDHCFEFSILSLAQTFPVLTEISPLFLALGFEIVIPQMVNHFLPSGYSRLPLRPPIS